MRVLVATTAGAGHFGPVVPFARALTRAGHDVVVAAPTSFAAAVERAGFVHRPFADAPVDAMGAVFAGLRGLSNEEGNEVVVREVFGRLDAQAALPGLR
ncbi:MAG: glycosyltransferase, partial [Actinomycetota bacterium]|nr:glycosyltransferase [Actinomycetota bacterium]